MKKTLIKTLATVSSLNALSFFSLSSCGGNSLFTTPFFYNIDSSSLFTPKYMVDNDYKGIRVYHFPDTINNYIKVKDFVNSFLKFKKYGETNYADFSCYDNGQQTIIINDCNQTKTIIDSENQTISFDDYDKFHNFYFDALTMNNPLAAGCHGGEKLLKIYESNYTGQQNELKINCRDYKIPIIRYQEEDYLPWEIMNNIISPINFPYFFNGNDFYQCPSSKYTNIDKMTFLNFMRHNMIKPNKNYLEYCYNSLAMYLDYKWGLKTRPSRKNRGENIAYFSNGAYDALAKYKNEMTSLEPNVANEAMLNFNKEQMDDGGHSKYNNINILCNKYNDNNDSGPETTNTINTLYNLKKIRTNLNKDHYQLIPDKTADDEIKSSVETYEINNNVIIYMAFDEFYDTDIGEGANTKYTDVSKYNYYKTSISLVMYTDYLIRSYRKNNKKVNLVIDLSCNVGGTVWIEHFIASWLCKTVKEKIYNPITGACGEYAVWADINTDGIFNEEDFLPSDVNIFCITSNATFSCGNFLSCNLKEQSNAKFIGDWTGGGSCYVEQINLGLGNLANISSTYHILNSNGADAEQGVKPDIDCYNDMSKIYNRDELNKIIIN